MDVTDGGKTFIHGVIVDKGLGTLAVAGFALRQLTALCNIDKRGGRSGKEREKPCLSD